MAPIHAVKRSRQLTDELYEDPADDSNHHPSAGKRARYSTEDVISASATPESTHYPGKEQQYGNGLLSDGTGDRRRAYDSDEDEINSNDAPNAGAVAHDMENHPADHAIIEEIVCVNFMCHAHLEVKLGPLINFIIGHNGSGKSAVLTAITLCLGGKATATNRGQNLKSFIKEGEESCVLSVQLKNQGPSAYKPDEYGRSIIVERHFSRAGTSGFKLKSALKKIVSTKRAELDDLLDVFSLQLDNPMNVLTQDQARQFLNHSNPADKYKFFMKGTQLEALDNDYNQMGADLDNIELQSNERQKDISVLKAKADEAQKLLELADKQESLHERIKDFSRQMAWAQVEQQERRLTQIEDSIRSADENIARLTAEAETAEEASRGAVEENERADNEIAELREGLHPHENKLDELKQDFDTNKAELGTLIVQQRTIAEEVQSQKKRKAGVEREIKDERDRLENTDGGQHSSKLREFEEAKVALETARQEHQSHADGLEALKDAREQASRAVDGGAQDLQDKRKRKQFCEQEIHNLQQGHGNWMAAYDSNLPQLLRAVDNEHRFRKKPVGPIGRHIRLLQEDWSQMLELASGNILNAFIVTSKEDQRLLSDLMSRTKCTSTILIGHERRIDTTANEPHPDLLTWKRALEIDNDLVHNSLVINQSIDQVVLIKDRTEAMSFMFGTNKPPKVKVCLCQQDGTNKVGLRLSYTSTGGETVQPIQANSGQPPPKRRMKGNMELRLNLERENLRSHQREVDDAERRKRHLGEQLTAAQREIASHQKEKHTLKVEEQRAEDRAHHLKSAVDEATPTAGKIEALEGDLQELKADIDIAENSFKESVTTRDKLDRQQRDLKSRMDGVQADLNSAQANISRTEAEAKQLEDRRIAAVYENNRAHALVNDAKGEKSEHEKRREAQQTRIEEFEEKAQQISPRVPVNPSETAETLDKKLHKLFRERERAQQELGGSREEISEQALLVKNAWLEQKRSLQMLDMTAQAIKEAMMNRMDRWNKFRKFIRLRAVNTFMYLLSEREFRGRLDIDHADRTLKIKIEPDITKANDKGRQTSTLSGGEKSFSTICLLIALWDAMGSPIRCLDEFDVFMDNVNRDVSMKMIIQAARRSVSRQFIFITPQSMGSVALDTDVKIIKMSDPERGQTALQFNT